MEINDKHWLSTRCLIRVPESGQCLRAIGQLGPYFKPMMLGMRFSPPQKRPSLEGNSPGGGLSVTRITFP